MVGLEVPDLDISTMSGRSFDAVSSVMFGRRYPLPDALEVDLNSVDSAAHDRRRLGAGDVVEVCWLDNERRCTIDFTVSVVVRFLRRPRRAQLSQILAYRQQH